LHDIANVNSSRGNDYYDLSDTNHASYIFPAHTEAPQCSSDFDSWEPPSSVKGDIARAIFYMDVRYEAGTNTEPDLLLTEAVHRIASTNAHMGRLVALLFWHEQDPVDSAERLRNDRVFSLYQHNRNPFVDHPEWVREIFWPKLEFVYPILVTNMAIVRWHEDFTTGVLQSSTNLGTGWSDVPTDPGEPHWAVFQILTGQRKFYRLRLW
jgi:hypothetical protein